MAVAMNHLVTVVSIEGKPKRAKPGTIRVTADQIAYRQARVGEQATHIEID